MNLSFAPLRRTASFLAVFATTTLAPVFGGTLQLNKTSHSDVGGVFAVTQAVGLDVSHYDSAALYTATTGNKQSGFGTFCLEYSEPFNPGDVFNYSIAPYANAGGVAGHSAPGQDMISVGTAWVYSLFAMGTLDDHSLFSYTSTANLRSLQKAFWFLEDEGQGNLNNVYVQLAVSQFGSLAAAKTHSNGAYGVSVLNLTKNGQLKQSQLYFGGLPQQVPDEATTAGMLLGAFVALAALRRGRRA